MMITLQIYTKLTRNRDVDASNFKISTSQLFKMYLIEDFK